MKTRFTIESVACTVQFHGSTAGVGISGSRCGGVRALARMHVIFVVAHSFQNQINMCFMTLSLALCAAGDVALGDCQEVGGCHEPQSKTIISLLFHSYFKYGKTLFEISKSRTAGGCGGGGFFEDGFRGRFRGRFRCRGASVPPKILLRFHQFFK